MATDKNTIGVSKENDRFLDELVEQGLFSDQIDAAKLAISIAIRHGVTEGAAAGAETKWNVGSFDKDGHLRTLLPVLFPNNSTPYRLAEHLIHEGLGLLRTHIRQNGGFDVTKLADELGSAKLDLLGK